MKKLIYLFAALTLFCACQERYKDDYPTLKMDKESFTYGYTATKALLYIYYNNEWTAEVTKGADWATIDKTSGTGVYANHLRFSANNGVSRLCEVTVRGGEDVWIMKVIQSGKIAVPKIIFTKSEKTIVANRTSATLSVDSNLPMDVFKEIVPTIVYPDTVQAWLSDVTILEKEDSIEIPDMPDGTRRYVQLGFSENTLGKDRQAAIELAVVNATGEKFSGAVAIAQLGETSKISLPTEDRVSKLGGERNIPVTTNLEEEIALATVEVQYLEGSDFISDAHVTENAVLVYTVDENTGDTARKATITVSCDGQSASITVNQKAKTASYTNFTIESIFDFLDWASDYSAWKSTDNITLATDIDLTGQNYVPRDFLGVFDGQNYTIKGINIELTTNAGFFASLSGTLKNVNFGTADGQDKITCSATATNSCAGLVAIMSDNAVIDNVVSYVDIIATGAGVHNLGGFAGLLENTGSISNCVNYGDVTMSAVTTSTGTFMGGIAGYMTAACAISHCDNYGEIYCSAVAPSSGGTLNMGGILGKSIASGSIEYCNNSGKIIFENAGTTASTTTNMSGLLGMTATLPLTKFDNCMNLKGADIINRGPTKFVDAGGFIAQYEIATPITNCTNEADLYFYGTSPYHYVGCAIGNIPLNITAGAMKNCTAKSNLTFAASSSTTSGLRAGLFAGAVASNCSFENCSSEGTLENNSKSCKGTRLGGFIGSISSGTGTVKNCTAKYVVMNKAAALPDAVQYMAGLVAFNTPSSFSFTDCSVDGSISSTIKSTTEVIGGLVGHSTKASAMTRCSSKCDITPANDQVLTKIGAFIGYFSANPSVSSCSIYPSTFVGIKLTSSNYGSYLKGSASSAANVNTTNVSFKEE